MYVVVYYTYILLLLSKVLSYFVRKYGNISLLINYVYTVQCTRVPQSVSIEAFTPVLSNSHRLWASTRTLRKHGNIFSVSLRVDLLLLVALHRSNVMSKGFINYEYKQRELTS